MFHDPNPLRADLRPRCLVLRRRLPRVAQRSDRLPFNTTFLPSPGRIALAPRKSRRSCRAPATSASRVPRIERVLTVPAFFRQRERPLHDRLRTFTQAVRDQPRAPGRVLETPRPGATTPRGFLRQNSLRRPPPPLPTLRILRACVSLRPIVPRRAHAQQLIAMTRPVRPQASTSEVERARPTNIL